jgi:DNA-binding transcriptional ArsR family regulator
MSHYPRGSRAKNAVLLMIKRLIEDPAYPKDFQRELDLSRGTVKYHLGRFLQYGIVKRLEDGKYAFINYAKGKELVIEAVKHWKSLAFCYPPVEEIVEALRVAYYVGGNRALFTSAMVLQNLFK